MTRDSSSWRVFVVDDERVIASTLAAILQLNGFAANYFVHPLHALDAARVNPPDLLISDVMMPELSGVELAIRIKALCPNCKVLLFSGQAATADLLLAAREQGHDFQLLSKPIHPTELLAQVGKLAQQPVK
jgi:DNA-binding response OmpR family regulator